VGDVTHFRQCVQRLPVVVNELLSSYLVLLRVFFLYWWRMVSKDGWFIVSGPSPLHLSLLPRKSTLILISVSDSVLLVLIFYLFPFLYVLPAI